MNLAIGRDETKSYVGYAQLLKTLCLDPGRRDTLAGIDGMYWYKGSLVGVQYGTSAYRVTRWYLSPEGCA